MSDMNVRILRERPIVAVVAAATTFGAAGWLLGLTAGVRGLSMLLIYCVVGSSISAVARVGGRSVLVDCQSIRWRKADKVTDTIVDFVSVIVFGTGLLAAFIFACAPGSISAESLTVVSLSLLICHCVYTWSKLGRRLIPISQVETVRIEAAQIRGKNKVTVVGKDGSNDSIGLFKSGPTLASLMRELGTAGLPIERSY